MNQVIRYCSVYRHHLQQLRVAAARMKGFHFVRFTCTIINCLIIATLLIWLQILPWTGSSVASAQQPVPTPTIDRLATPVVSDQPTQIESGLVSYYYNCMPCHGDRGQGLTEEWRQVWVEDHQDCWARGCHGGRGGDEGFPLPSSVPPVSGVSGSLHRFDTEQDLYEYLQDTHPPQQPGALPEDEYWALTAYLLSLNGRLPAGKEIGSGAALQVGSQSEGSLVIIPLGILLGFLLAFTIRQQLRS